MLYTSAPLSSVSREIFFFIPRHFVYTQNVAAYTTSYLQTFPVVHHIAKTSQTKRLATLKFEFKHPGKFRSAQEIDSSMVVIILLSKASRTKQFVYAYFPVVAEPIVP